MVKVSLILPVYNEADILEKNVTKTLDFMKGNFGDFEIIIAEDGSTDGTDKIAKRIAKNRKIINIHTDRRIGRGASISNAIRRAKFDMVAYMDIDLATDLKYLKPLFGRIEKGADVAVGSRYHELSESKRDLIRLFMSKCYNIFARILFRLRLGDFQCGFKAFRKSTVLPTLRKIKANHWFWDTEMLVRLSREGYKIKSIPVEWKESKESKVNTVRDSLRMGWKMLKLFIDVNVSNDFEKKVMKHFDNQSELYDEFNRKNPFNRIVNKKIQDVVPNGSVLDVGVGTGYLLDKINSDLKYGIDVSRSMLKVSRRKIRDGLFVCGKGELIPFVDNSIDFIICSEMLEHVGKHNVSYVLNEIQRISKMGTKVLITTPNGFWFPIRWIINKLRIFWKDGGEGPHEYLSYKELEREISERFKVLEMGTVGFLPGRLGIRLICLAEKR
jgi:glycosyltransferase involved in cell wall biosynthesis